MRAVTLLSFWKIRNSLKTLFSDPRKYVPLVIFLCLLSIPIALSTIQLPGSRDIPGRFHIEIPLLQSVIFLILIVLSVITLDTGLGDGLLAFGMSDVDYLFPSPISRRVVLAYRLPALTLGALVSSLFVIYMFRVGNLIFGASIAFEDRPAPPAWLTPAAIALCVGLYLNVAMFIAIRFANRRTLHRVLMGAFYVGGGVLGIVGWLQGVTGFTRILNSTALGWAFYPAWLVAKTVNATFLHETYFGPVAQLGVGYLISFIPLFATNSNYYEQSISSSEKVSTIRNAAKGGYASLMASKAATHRHKSSRMYTVPPFGQGAMALFWAHLSAAAKKPLINFGAPAFAGIVDGLAASIVDVHAKMFGLGVLFFLSVYISIGFMATAKTAAEAAVRRRELLTPLPIKGWQFVLANLGVPIGAATIFSFCAAITYAATGAELWPLVLFGLAIFFPIRLASRMVLQYVIVLGYPDFADKVQQFLSTGIYYLIAAPLLLPEAIICIPAFFLHSLWIGAICLTLIDGGILVLLLILAGYGSDRAVATGEPVNILRLLTRRDAL